MPIYINKLKQEEEKTFKSGGENQQANKKATTTKTNQIKSVISFRPQSFSISQSTHPHLLYLSLYLYLLVNF